MECDKYIEQINTDVSNYQRVYYRPPQLIFMSNHLWGMLFTEDCCPVFANMGDKPTYHGIPVYIFISDKFEYYFASFGYTFKDED